MTTTDEHMDPVEVGQVRQLNRMSGYYGFSTRWGPIVITGLVGGRAYYRYLGAGASTSTYDKPMLGVEQCSATLRAANQQHQGKETSMGDVIKNIEPPEGMEAYLEDGVIRFRLIQQKAVLEVRAARGNRYYLREEYSYGEWGEATSSFPVSDSPVARNCRNAVTVTVLLAHPDSDYVEEAWELLKDYVQYHLPSLIEDNMTVGPEGR